MKKIAQYILSEVVFLSVAVPVFAETGAREDNSMTLVYLFLGVCGLIILLQLLPVFALGLGIIKGFFSGEKKETGPLKH